MEIPGGGGVLWRPLEKKILRGWGSNWKKPPVEGYGYLLEPHIVSLVRWEFVSLYRSPFMKFQLCSKLCRKFAYTKKEIQWISSTRLKLHSSVFMHRVNNSLWKREIAWERSRAASAYGIIWGTQVKTNIVKFRAECHSVDCSGDSKV